MIKQALTVAQQFAPHYYQLFDSNRQQLDPLYVDCSILQFEGAASAGKVEIIKKLTSLPFQTVQHVITTVDGQPTIDSGIIVLVVGQLRTDNDQPHGFSETFHLKKNGENFVILNQSFRLSIHSM